ncbi:TlpA family protein disulfide reductase [Bacteroidales bacterium OttesenSCG-928-I14]|nr:TlpA family protein disulfide reductase [Bacteroidales bacterium OttesenSCG-928-I14]
MKKIIYIISLIVLISSCGNKDYYQIAVDNESKLDSLSGAAWDEQFEKTKTAYALYFEQAINTEEGRELFSSSKWVRRLNADQLEKVLNAADDEYKTNEYYQTQISRLENMKNTVVGNQFKDFASKDINGDTISLSDYVGKGNYVLLDFWASWCPPCREEMPNLVKIYEEYKDKGFEIVGYSLDKREIDWINGIEKMGMTWPQMSDLQFWTSPAVNLYAVQSIPCTFLIDPEGKIIERGIIGDKLLETIESLLK